jgi:hypothetical protein
MLWCSYQDLHLNINININSTSNIYIYVLLCYQVVKEIQQRCGVRINISTSEAARALTPGASNVLQITGLTDAVIMGK